VGPIARKKKGKKKSATGAHGKKRGSLKGSGKAQPQEGRICLLEKRGIKGEIAERRGVGKRRGKRRSGSSKASSPQGFRKTTPKGKKKNRRRPGERMRGKGKERRKWCGGPRYLKEGTDTQEFGHEGGRKKRRSQTKREKKPKKKEKPNSSVYGVPSCRDPAGGSAQTSGGSRKKETTHTQHKPQPLKIPSQEMIRKSWSRRQLVGSNKTEEGRKGAKGGKRGKEEKSKKALYMIGTPRILVWNGDVPS